MIFLFNRYLHKHLGVNGWCDCKEMLKEESKLSFKGIVKFILFTEICWRKRIKEV